MDIFFYHRPVVVPFNIIKYNVLGGSDRGPNIFGTEPWHFYIRNLLLNFNVWFLLALLAMPLLLLRAFFVAPSTALSRTRMRGLTFVSPFYMWLTLFSLQRHKEERFMYPMYPALALNAAVSLYILLVPLIGVADQGATTTIGRSSKFKQRIIWILGLVTMSTGLLRTVGMVTAYSAPIQVHRALLLRHKHDMVNAHANICYGKEWYRYPSSFFLPDGFRAKFVKSAFDGLLPGEFSEAKVGFGFWPTWLVPSGMNDRNEEDVGKYVRRSLSLSLSHIPKYDLYARHCSITEY